MKQITGIALMMCLLIMTGCSKDQHPGDPAKKTAEAPVHEIKVNTAVATNINGFAFNLMDHIQDQLPGGGNIFVSPLSLHMDLGMLLNGANGTTYTEMQQALSLDKLNLETINQVYATLLKELPVADPKVQLGLYNSMWYRNNLGVNSNYEKTLKSDFQAEVTGLEFNSAAVKNINQWASDKTNGKITSVIDKINPEEVMFLLNALYFKGSWSIQFDKAYTNTADFHKENGQTSQVQMMHNAADFSYYIGDDYAAVRLPYGNGQFSMTVILPSEGKKIGDLISHFSDQDWTALQTKMTKEKVNIGLPRFTIPTFEIQLNPVLQKMGMITAFDRDRADLSKMSTAKQLYVSFVKQNSYLRVDEEGTEAAAVTTTGIGTTSATISPSIICDHPFELIISEKTSNTILFMGRIMAPESGN